MKTALKYLVSIACIVYVFWGIDFRLLLRSFVLLDPAWIVVGQTLLMVGLLPAAYRIRYIAHGEVSFRTGLCALLVAFAWNTLLPARLGELAKAIALSRRSPVSMEHAMGIVFWERFADLNCILLVAGATAYLMHLQLALVPIGAIVGTLWACLYIIKGQRKLTNRLLALIPLTRVRLFSENIVEALSKNMQLGHLVQLGALTVVIWCSFIASILIILMLGTSLPLTVNQSMVIVVAGVLGIAIPSAPAAVGVYEAFVVSAIMLTGVEKEQALAIALVLHVVQTLLPTLLGLAISPGILSRNWKEIDPQSANGAQP